MRNIGYFFKETKNLFKIDLFSNIFSIFSIGLILLILATIISGLIIGNEFVDFIENEAEINVYYNNEIIDPKNIISEIKNIKGIKEAKLINEDQAYIRMEDVLGKEAKVLGYFEDNPFKAFIEVEIELEDIEGTITNIESINGVDEIRDNREVLIKLKSIIQGLKVLGAIMFISVGISTIFVISHIIRQGIYNNREEIITLRLLGASKGFIGMPFIMEGLILTLAGGILATGITYLGLNYIYNNIYGIINIIPLPPYNTMISGIIILIISLSFALGIIGSLFGLNASVKSS